MALQRITLTPGINKEATRTAGKGGWFDSDKVRFKNGAPEKIGGWVPITMFTVKGVPRALRGWVALDGTNLLGIGTHLKYYTEVGGTLQDITPIRHSSALEPSELSSEEGTNRVVITNLNHGAIEGDYVEIVGSPEVGGIPAEEINIEHEIVEVITPSEYVIEVKTTATSTETVQTSDVTFTYQTNVGIPTYVSGVGWGAPAWGEGKWGEPHSVGIGQQLVLWNHDNFGQTLLYGQRGGPIYKWDPTADRGLRGSKIEGDEVPLMQDVMLVSDVSRFVLVFGTNPLGSTEHDPLLIRWSDQENYAEWAPSITNQAGFIRVSDGSFIVTALQTKQETLVWTDSALYSMQYVGGAIVWSIEMQMNNLSIMSPRAAVSVSNLVFWMGKDKFYMYTGRVDPLPCSLTSFIFAGMNKDQTWQVFAATNEGFNEVWWFYCSKNSLEVDSYVIYNYVEQVWAHGTMNRTAWTESPGRPNPIATTQDGQLLYHEYGTDDITVNGAKAMESHIFSSDVDIGEGEHFGFVWRMIPDISFTGSSATNPRVNFGLAARSNPGADYYKEPTSPVQRLAEHPVEQFTEYVYTRVRGRQMAMRISSNQRGVHWRLGTPRVDIKADGRKT